MPIWLFWTITFGALATSFKCDWCQQINSPKQPPQVVQQGEIIKAIRDTPVIVPRDSLDVMLIPDAHAYYDSVYTNIVNCAKLPFSRDEFDSINFYVADRAAFAYDEYTVANAFYDDDSKSIVLGLKAVWNRRIVGHEILHALLAANGINSENHPSFFFDVMCKNEVTSFRRPNDG